MITRTSCRVCDSALHPVLSLGEHYVSDFPPPGEPDGVKAPLELALCTECSLLQLRHTVPAETMYRNYWYRSGTNRTMREALADITGKAEQLIHLRNGDAVLDIGCNDGTLLGSYKTPGLFKIGFDPAENLAVHSRQHAHKIVPDFFQAKTFLNDPQLAPVNPKIVTSIAMFYDLEDPRKFVSDVKTVMHSDGLWVIQMSYLPVMLRSHDVGNVCHEHLEYYSLRSLQYLLRLHDLEIVDMETNDVNGGSFRVYVRNRGAPESTFGDSTYRALANGRLSSFRNEEGNQRLAEQSTYKEFGLWVERIKADVVGFIREQVARNKTVFAYGASTKGNTLLQYFGLDHTLITAAAERNPDKWGRMTVGTHIPIVSEDEARAARPDYLLVLPWHFLSEFQEREKDYLLAGGRFILATPHFALI